MKVSLKNDMVNIRTFCL